MAGILLVTYIILKISKTENLGLATETFMAKSTLATNKNLALLQYNEKRIVNVENDDRNHA